MVFSKLFTSGQNYPCNVLGCAHWKYLQQNVTRNIQNRSRSSFGRNHCRFVLFLGCLGGILVGWRVGYENDIWHFLLENSKQIQLESTNKLHPNFSISLRSKVLCLKELARRDGSHTCRTDLDRILGHNSKYVQYKCISCNCSQRYLQILHGLHRTEGIFKVQETCFWMLPVLCSFIHIWKKF